MSNKPKLKLGGDTFPSREYIEGHYYNLLQRLMSGCTADLSPSFGLHMEVLYPLQPCIIHLYEVLLLNFGMGNQNLALNAFRFIQKESKQKISCWPISVYYGYSERIKK